MAYDSLKEEQRYLLLQLIKERPIIYDRHHEKYKCFEEKEIAWQEVAEKCNAQMEACKVAWRSMRDQYQRNMRLPKEKRKKFRYLSSMSFLVGYTKDAKPSNSPEHDISEYYFENTSDVPKNEMVYEGESTDYGDYNDIDSGESAKKQVTKERISIVPVKTNFDKENIGHVNPPFSADEEEYIFIKDRTSADGNVEAMASELFDTFNNLISKHFQPQEDDNDIFIKMLAKKMKPLPKLVKNRLQECFLEQVNYEIVNFEVQKHNKK